MPIQTFPLAKLRKVRQYIKNTLIIPKLELLSREATAEELDMPPEPESVDDLSGLFSIGSIGSVNTPYTGTVEQWIVSTVNPGACLLKLPGLSLNPQYRLVSYVYYAQDSSAGIVWAVPVEMSTTAQLEQALAKSKTIAQLPKPVGALPHFMEAIEGDRSPTSYILASILRRELQEFGAAGARQNWSHHRLLDTIPPNIDWKWRHDIPDNFSPKLKNLPDGQMVVEFFTCRTVAPVAMYRHIDQYHPEGYKPNTIDQSIAVAQGRL
jgi:hypothetical protein